LKAPDLYLVTQLDCPSAPCTGLNVCCYATSSGAFNCRAVCNPGEVVLTCSDSRQCPVSTPICCASITFGPAIGGLCSTTGYDATCAASCPANINLACSNTVKGPMCSLKEDCAGLATPYCCKMLNGYACVGASIKNAPGVQCL
jgi:hypothetical protein